MTVSVRLVVAPATRSPIFVQTTWLPMAVAVGVALTKATPTGRLSVTEIDIAVDGPKFVTLIR